MMHDWIFSPDQVKESPTKRAGMSTNDENKMRREGVKIIMEIGNQMKLRANPTLATAGVFFHRFYMFHSFQEFPRELSALGCLFLAGKVEETPKKCRDLVTCAKHRFPSLYQQHRNLLDEVMGIERVLLQTLHFDLAVEHPYKHLVQYAKKFNYSQDDGRKLVQTAWTFVNDSIGTTLCLQWEPQILAIALFNLSLKLSHKVEQDGWWDDYVTNLSNEMVEEVCHKVLDYYSAVKTEKYDFMKDAVSPDEKK